MFTLKIVEPEKVVFQGQASIVNIKTGAGEMGILTNQAPMVETILPSEMTYIDDKDERHVLATSNGWLIVRDNHVTLYVNSLEFKNEIDIERAMNDRERAEQLLKEGDLDTLRAIQVKLALEKAINRINVYNK